MLLHGLSVPSIIWQDVAPQLAASGFRVLIYGPSVSPRLHFTRSLSYVLIIPRTKMMNNEYYADLYGRGYSDAPNMAYDAGLYTTQLALLMQYVRWERAHVVGFSMVSLSSRTPRRAWCLCNPRCGDTALSTPSMNVDS